MALVDTSGREVIASEAAINLPLYVMSRTLSIAEVTALNGTPIKLIDAIPGYVVWVRWGAFYRESTEYLTAAATIYVQCVNSSPFNWVQLPGLWLTSTTRNAYVSLSTVTAAGASSDPSDAADKDTRIYTATNPTVDATSTGSPIKVVLWYHKIPVAGSNMP